MTVVAEIPSDGPGYSLSRVSGVLALDDGTFLVSDLGERALLRFTASGTFVARVGRAGDGPGEFRLPLLIGRGRDGVWVSDPMLRRVTTFSADYRTVRTRQLSVVGPAAMTEDGSVLVFKNDGSSVRGPGSKRRTTSVVRLAEGEAPRTIATWVDEDLALRIAAGPGAFDLAQPFVDRVLSAVDPGGRHLMVVSKGAGSGEVRVLRLGPAGDTTGVALLEVPPVTVTEALVTRTVDSVVRVLSGPAKQRAGVALSATAVRSALIRPSSRGGVAESAFGPGWPGVASPSLPGQDGLECLDHCRSGHRRPKRDD
ncbi:MAG: 6-bladed beta-propeller [Gemmatimonadales bacterium]